MKIEKIEIERVPMTNDYGIHFCDNNMDFRIHNGVISIYGDIEDISKLQFIANTIKNGHVDYKSEGV